MSVRLHVLLNRIIALAALSLFVAMPISISGRDNQEIIKVKPPPPEDDTVGFQSAPRTRGLPPLKELDIQALIDKAGDGDTLKIPFGKYVLEKGLIIKGRKNFTFKCDRGSQIFVKDIEEDIILVENCEGIRIEDCRLQHVKPLMSYECHGSVVRITDSKNITVFNSELSGCGAIGVSAWNSKSITVENCFIHHNTWTALYFHKVEGIRVTNCIIEENDCFAQMNEVDNIHISNNVIRRNGQHDVQEDTEPGLKE